MQSALPRIGVIFGTNARIANNLVYDQGTIGISAGGNAVTLPTIRSIEMVAWEFS